MRGALALLALLAGCRTPPFMPAGAGASPTVSRDLAPAAADLSPVNDDLRPPAGDLGACGVADPFACPPGASACCPWIEASGPACTVERDTCVYWRGDHESQQSFCTDGQWMPLSHEMRWTSWDYNAECADGLPCFSVELGCVVPFACRRCTCGGDGLLRCEGNR
jgi:hypothetical protein